MPARSAPALIPTLRRLRRGGLAAASTRDALLLRWAQEHAVPAARIDDHLSGNPVPAEAQAGLLGLALSLKDLEQALEWLEDADHRRRQGAVYTPNDIIDHLIEESLSLAGDRGRGRVPVLLDNACGSAGFLIRAAQHLQARSGLSAEVIVRDQLVGFDNDPRAIENSRCLLDLYLAAQGCPSVPATALRVMQADAIQTPAGELLRLADQPDGFDAIVTNPPYIKIQLLTAAQRQALAAQLPTLATGNFNVSSLFLVQSLALLAPRGVLGCITPNNLFTSLSARGVRQVLQERRALVRVVDFQHQKVFANASTYTCLLFLRRAPSETFGYAALREAPTRAALRAAVLEPLAHADLDAARWRLMPSRHARNIQRIEAAGTPLGRRARIRVGIATLCDSVYVVRQQDAQHALPLRDAPGHRIELAVTRPLCRVADQEPPAEVDLQGLRVIFPYEAVGGRLRLLPEAVLREGFPGAWRWLAENRARLAQRDKGRKDYGAWYGWGRTQSMTAPGPKLLTKTFSRGPGFCLDRSDALFCNGYAVTLDAPQADGLSLEILQRIMNSVVMDYYARLTSFQIEGDYQCYQKNFIERFGVIGDVEGLAGLEGAALDRELARRYGLPWADVAEICSRHAGADAE